MGDEDLETVAVGIDNHVAMEQPVKLLEHVDSHHDRRLQ
jgi:hypothetical protein